MRKHLICLIIVCFGLMIASSAMAAVQCSICKKLNTKSECPNTQYNTANQNHTKNEKVCVYTMIKMTYDTPEFRKLLSLWKTMWNDDLIFCEDNNSSPQASSVLILSTSEVSSHDIHTYIPMPLLEMEKCYHTTVISLGVNARSPHKEKAAELLGIYTSRDNIVKEIDENTGIYQKDIDYLLNAPEDMLFFPKNRLESDRILLQYGARDVYYEGVQNIVEIIFSKYFSGNISEDELISALNEALNRHINE